MYSNPSSPSPLKGFSLYFSLITSLFFQVILTLFGSFRKCCSSKWLTFFLWSAYQLADVAATACLGILTSFPSDEMNEIAPIWSSFLLLHLGGPDSITAISLVDNELYFRHSIQLLYRVGVAVYIHVKLFLVSRGNVGGSISWFAVLIWMLLAGISKYAERTWALHSANMGNLRDSMIPPPNSGPIPLVPGDDHDHPQFIPMDEYAFGTVVAPEVAPSPSPNDGSLLKDQLDFDKAILLRACQYFYSFKCLFVDLLIPCSNNVINTQRFFLQCPCGVAFQLIDVELRFMYDMLFTKALVVRTSLACNLRFLRYCAILYALIVFIRSGELSNSPVEILFFSWALIQEAYEIIQMLLTEWTVIWLHKHNFKRLSTIILKLILFYRLLGSKLISRCGVGEVTSKTTTRRNSWCYNNIMAQYNLLSFCFKDKPTMFRRILHLSSWGKSIHEWVTNSQNTTHMHVSNDKKEFIYHQFKERVQTFDEEIRSAEFRNPRGKLFLKMNNCSEHNYLEELGWSIDVEFDQSILIWHVATDLCHYFDDLDSIECQATILRHQVKMSKALSDYLLYVLLILPFMLNNKIGKIRFQDTCAAIKKLFDHVPKDKREKNLISLILQREKSSLGEKQTQVFIKRLLMSDAQVLTRDPEADRSKSVLLEAHKLAKLLTSFAVEERWKIISGVWVEMLSYAASNCSGKHHAQRLSDGGEFLTKIWLLMAHLGMIE